jgi:hypothetical protein
MTLRTAGIASLLVALGECHVSFAAVCAPDALAGIWLWQGRMRGVRLGMVTSPLAFILGVGFALPFLLVGVPIRLGLTWAGQRSLR